MTAIIIFCIPLSLIVTSGLYTFFGNPRKARHRA